MEFGFLPVVDKVSFPAGSIMAKRRLTVAFMSRPHKRFFYLKKQVKNLGLRA
jgi:hypothetical protein